MLVGLDHARFCTPTLISALKSQYRLRVVAITDGITDGSFPLSVKDAVDTLYVIRRPTGAHQARFAYEDLRRVLRTERKAFPHRELRLVCESASGAAVGRLRREFGLRGPSDDVLIQFQSGGRNEALLAEEGLKAIRRVELRGSESYDRLIEAVGKGFVMRSLFGSRRVGSHEDYGRLLRNTKEVRWLQAQEHLEGDFFHIDTIRDGRRRVFQAVSEYTCSPQQAEGRAFGSMPLPRGDALEMALRRFADQVHQVLQPRDLSTHMEVVVTNGQTLLVDIAARLPRAGVQRCLLSNFSINLADLDLQVQTGLPVPIVEVEPVPAFWVRFPNVDQLARLGANLAGGVSSLVSFDGACDEIDEAAGGRPVLVRNRCRDLLRQDFERVRAPLGNRLPG